MPNHLEHYITCNWNPSKGRNENCLDVLEMRLNRTINTSKEVSPYKEKECEFT